ncbi:MAG: proline racemase family protein [Pirellulaceae bacterium]
MTKAKFPDSIRVIDSHTGGEPTRIIVENGPDLGRGPLAERLIRFREQFDSVRRGVILEPRGSDVIVGALPVEPHEPDCAAGVIFFNNTDYLGMCGHGTIGLMVTLHYLGRLPLGEHWIDTPVGRVKTILHDANRVTVENVASYRFRQSVTVPVEGYGDVNGDIAWGGNWFFLVERCEIAIQPENIELLTHMARAVRRSLDQNGITGADGGLIDHIELFGDGASIGCDSRSYVFCPGGEYDRSPCGTGTSAKLACLAADGKLAPGQSWKQGSVIGSVFEASYEWDGEQIKPRITGSAYISGDNRLMFDPNDPFISGIEA